MVMLLKIREIPLLHLSYCFLCLHDSQNLDLLARLHYETLTYIFNLYFILDIFVLSQVI